MISCATACSRASNRSGQIVESTPSRPRRYYLTRQTDAGSVPCSATIQAFHEFRPDAFAAPALKAGLAEMPAGGQLFLIEVSDFHLGLLPNELAGVHEGAVPRVSQAIVGADPFAAKKRSWRSSENRATVGVNGCQFGIESGSLFPDRETNGRIMP